MAPHTPAHFQGTGASCHRPGPRSQAVGPELAQISETAHPLRDSEGSPGTWRQERPTRLDTEVMDRWDSG